ncbi:hypothetical protein GCM10027416_06500 [Okibacterium endophyticum]
MTFVSDGSAFIRRREVAARGIADYRLQTRVKRGEIVRVVTGAYLNTADWRALVEMEQHRMRVLATSERVRSGVVYSHFAAAALWGIRLLGRWPRLVDVTLDRASGGRSTGGLRRRCTGLDGVEVTTVDGLTVTTPAQTAVDLARVLPFADAVVALDSAQWSRRRPVLAQRDEILFLIERARGKRGYRRVRAAAEFSTSLSDSPAESESRVQLHLLGFPEPVLQKRFLTPGGKEYFTDFYWEECDHIGEADGRSKYRDPLFLHGRTPEQAVIDEKNRENELRRLVTGFSRWEPRDLHPPSRLYDILIGDGLPSARPRPWAR